MTAGETATWTGTAEFDAALAAWVARTEQETSAAFKVAEKAVSDEVAGGFGSGTAPHSISGALAASVSSTEPRPAGFAAYEATVGPMGLAYIRKTELGKAGAHYAAPHPFFEPGWLRSSDQLLAVFRTAWQAALPGRR